MYHRSTFGVDGGGMFYRHTSIDPNRQTLLCVHGLGDTGCVFRAAFFEVGLRDFNIIVPDLLGYGKSKSDTDTGNEYEFKKQVDRLYKLLDYLGIEDFSLIGHSMGGDLGTLMCTKYSQARIQAFVNIEGDLTQGDRFITDLAVEAHTRGSNNFEKWLRHELIDILFTGERAKFILSKKHYQKALKFCSAKAFWANVEEIRSLNENLLGHNYAEAARLFSMIKIHKKFWWGDVSVGKTPTTKKYLESNPFEHRSFDAFHWIMLDQRREFYDKLVSFLHSTHISKH